MRAKKGHEIDRMMIIKLFSGNYARDLMFKKSIKYKHMHLE